MALKASLRSEAHIAPHSNGSVANLSLVGDHLIATRSGQSSTKYRVLEHFREFFVGGTIMVGSIPHIGPQGAGKEAIFSQWFLDEDAAATK